MLVIHIAFTYLCSTLIYFHFHFEILVKIADSVLDSALALREKGRGYSERKTVSLAM